MQLVSFQIKECFGFRDSGRVDLQDPTNFIYVLGRNSSGKTSFLTALAHFAPGLIPQAHRNFTNFDPSTHASYLLGEYKVGEGDLIVDAFVKAFGAKMDELNRGTSATFGSNEYRRIKEELTNQLSTVYADLIKKVVYAGSMWVYRIASGEYRFSTEPSFKDCTERRKHQVPTLLTKVPAQLGIQVQASGQLFIGGSWQPFRQPTPDEIESLLAGQLPVILLFQEAYSLFDALPDIIKIEHISQGHGPMTNALIEYLGKTQVERLLKGQNPRERDEILSGLQVKINTLVDEVNRDHEMGTKLLAIDLSRVDGLQVTAITGDKLSFYRHLSENTKLLFAYHLYTAVYNLKDKVLLFDEPNNGFHATAQKRLLGFLRNLGVIGNLVVISTHSEHLLTTAEESKV